MVPACQTSALGLAARASAVLRETRRVVVARSDPVKQPRLTGEDQAMTLA